MQVLGTLEEPTVLRVAKYNEDDTSISFGFFNPNNGTIVTGGDLHIYDAPVETIKIVGK